MALEWPELDLWHPAQFHRLLSIKKIPLSGQKPYVKLADSILNLTQSVDHLHNPQKQAEVKALQREIDQMVYELYGLTEEETRIVKGEK